MFIGEYLAEIFRHSADVIPSTDAKAYCDGSWFDELTNRYAYRFDRDELQVLHGLADDVDLTMTFMSDDLLAFSANKLDLGRA